MTFRFFGALIGTAALAFTTAPVAAHHSFASYDMSKLVTASGSLKEFRWGAPHSSMVVIYKDKSGKPAQMSIISGSPLMFAKQGFAPRDFHAGDKVTVGYHPTVNGTPGGSLATLSMAGGRTFTDTEAAAIASPAK